MSDDAFREAKHLAESLFKKHYSHEEPYVSGKAKWELCESTAGIITQIDNMVADLVRLTENFVCVPKIPTQSMIFAAVCAADAANNFQWSDAYIAMVKAAEEEKYDVDNYPPDYCEEPL